MLVRVDDIAAIEINEVSKLGNESTLVGTGDQESSSRGHGGILDFGFWILDFGFWILDFGFWILDFGFWILDFGFWILDWTSQKKLLCHSNF
jgi:hypothetical protein